MLNSTRTVAYCNSIECGNSLDLGDTQRSEPAIRICILAGGWLIDLAGQGAAILVSSFVDTQAELALAVHSGQYPFENDRHYCSLTCVEQDT